MFDILNKGEDEYKRMKEKKSGRPQNRADVFHLKKIMARNEKIADGSTIKTGTEPLLYYKTKEDIWEALWLIQLHPGYLLKMFVMGEDGEIVFNGNNGDKKIR